MFRMKYWRASYFKSFFEMTDDDFNNLKTTGRINVMMINGREVIDIDTIYLPPKFQDKLEQLNNLT